MHVGSYTSAKNDRIGPSSLSNSKQSPISKQSRSLIKVSCPSFIMSKVGNECCCLTFSSSILGKVGEVGEAELVMPDDTSLVKAYSLTAAMYGFKLLYLEAGSGAERQVNPELIKSAKTTDGLTMIVGGGIRTPQQAQIAAEAGADWIVTGTLTEDATDLLDLRDKISAITDLLSIIN